MIGQTEAGWMEGQTDRMDRSTNGQTDKRIDRDRQMGRQRQTDG